MTNEKFTQVKITMLYSFVMSSNAKQSVVGGKICNPAVNLPLYKLLISDHIFGTHYRVF